MKRPERMVWGGHASRTLVAVVLVLHVAVLVWLCGSATRLRLIGYDFREVSSEAFVNTTPDEQRPFGYTEDDPSELRAFRAIAEPVVAGAATDVERLRRLGDYLYSLRRAGAPDFHGARFEPLSVSWPALRRGEHGSCAEMSALLAAFWRSLGGHSRAVRWATAEGVIGHDAVELYSTAYRRWVYYDMNLNGYGEDVDDGAPLSIASLRSNLLTGEGVHLVASPRLRDWDVSEFMSELRSFPVEWYALNNRALYFEANRRFGAFRRIGWLLSRLPPPLDRIVDNLVGERDRRLVVAGKIQIADLFTFDGARWFLAYLVAVTLVCGTTLAAPAVMHAVARAQIRRARRAAATRAVDPDVRFRDAPVPPPAN